MNKLINPHKFDKAVSVMRTFFKSKGFIEVHTQNALSILAACEDPKTISKYNYHKQEWPLPQTGQMWLEHVLLDNPDINGCFTVSTSYRNEPNPVPGRHEHIFPMFEFESKGTMKDLITMENELIESIGFPKHPNRLKYPEGDYEKMAKRYKVHELDHEHELMLEKDYGPVFLLKNFPYHTSPFWNMKKDGDVSSKVDVILHGVETIGSAERSCDKDEMRSQFLSISNGEYAGLLYKQFGKERVNYEMDQFLDRDFFPRYGGGIGITRMIKAMELSNLI